MGAFKPFYEDLIIVSLRQITSILICKMCVFLLALHTHQHFQ
jgi:hypothetical protein